MWDIVQDSYFVPQKSENWIALYSCKKIMRLCRLERVQEAGLKSKYQRISLKSVQKLHSLFLSNRRVLNVDVRWKMQNAEMNLCVYSMIGYINWDDQMEHKRICIWNNWQWQEISQLNTNKIVNSAYEMQIESSQFGVCHVNHKLQ